ncbi:MAG TPA: ammonia-forming cytochrome c nitrite reductase subunit c552, partial [Casimicrobiaceae bacterium]|nr:ammonia-forming cytochrome c nitrite reductase subunit c552 [Casimicrobiaceae bacterium]
AAALLVAVVVAGALIQYQRNRASPEGRPASGPAAGRGAAAAYVGYKACAECHATEAAAWRGSDHDLAMQVAGDKTVLGNFDGAKFRYAGTTSTFFRRGGKFYVNTDGPDGKAGDFEVKYTFGIHPLQQYLIELPGGRMQAFGIAWDSRPKEKGGQRWFHLYPDQNLKAGDPLHWTGNSQTWNFQCAECHSTNLRKGYDARTDTFHTTWSELDVSCEACHGPGSNHLAWAKRAPDAGGYDQTKGLVVALDERKGVRWTPVAETGNARRSVPRAQAREVDTCARCHGRAARLSDDEPHGRPPLDTHRLSLLEPGLYWDDGQMRDEVYNWGPFVQSRMYAKGVTCSDCHDPHSLKLRAAGNGVCAQCHRPDKYDVEAHSHHTAGSAGAACAGCHMPTTTYMRVDPRHDHSIRIPRPDLSASLGTPNACTNCHADKTPQWAAAAISRWTGKTPSGYQRFAEAFAAGSSGALEARRALLAVVDDKEAPAIVRASALARLAPWLTASTLPKATNALNDPDPIVRLAAVEALASAPLETRRQFLPRMLQDPVLAVRIEAAHALAGAAEAGLGEADRAAFKRAIDDYVAVQTYNADRPEGRSSLANLYAERGDAEAAIAQYRKAIELDPTFVQAYANLADLYRARGAETEAEAALRAGLARNPKAAALHYALGLALTRQKRPAEALKALAEAARLDPTQPRYAYVYAVALNDSGRRKDALRTLEAARRRSPYDRDVLSALVHYTAAAGDREAALRYVRQLQELDPESREYAALAAQIRGAGP